MIECNDQNKYNMIYLQKSVINHYKKYNIFDEQEVLLFQWQLFYMHSQ